MDLPYTLHLGDSREVLKTLTDNSVDAIVTDPPYGLSKEPDMAEVLRHWLAGDDYTASGSGFMGKTWDSFVPGPAVWRECIRVLKPGGHLLAFFGSRTYDLGTLAIRLAGFEVRDQIFWMYASGFPKSMNIDRECGKSICGCVVTQPYNHGKNRPPKNQARDAECDMRRMREGVSSGTVSDSTSQDPKLQPPMQWKIARTGVGETRLQGPSSTKDNDAHVWREQPSMEGRSDATPSARQLRASEVRTGTTMGDTDGTEGWLCDGTPPDHGGMVRIPADTDGGCSPRRPHAAEQCKRQPRAMAGQPKPQAMGAWPICGGCGLPMVPKGLGTALKPAHEPIVVARKPLIGTVAANVLEHGTGALNIDACRVGDEVRHERFTSFAPCHGNALGKPGTAEARRGTQGEPKEYVGRWPANLIHDGSDEVLEAFAQFGEKTSGKPCGVKAGGKGNAFGHFNGGIPVTGFGDTGSAARFFYSAKVSKSERNEGMPDGLSNNHPTLKPVSLMAYLCRLVTPPGGVVLDPFMGSGSTGKACMREGFRFIGIDLTPEYVEIARARIAHELAKQTPVPDVPAPQMDLFGDAA